MLVPSLIEKPGDKMLIMADYKTADLYNADKNSPRMTNC